MRKIGITFTMYKTAEEGGEKAESYIELPVSDTIFAGAITKSYADGYVSVATTIGMIAMLQGYHLDEIETIEPAEVE